MSTQQHLRKLLNQLHTELQQAHAVDDRSRELLRSVLRDIEDVLAHAGEAGQRSESITKRLREAVGAFEETHPMLTETVGRVADALAKMGI